VLFGVGVAGGATRFGSGSFSAGFFDDGCDGDVMGDMFIKEASLGAL
jgi:hypothetical protein